MPFEALPTYPQVLRVMDEDVPYKAPSPEDEEAFLAAPAHILARITRDLFADEDTAHATLAVNGPVLYPSYCCPHTFRH